MKLDTDWPVPPRPGVPLYRQPRAELATAERTFAVDILVELAKFAAGEALPIIDGVPTLLPEERPYRSASQFISHQVRVLESMMLEIATPLPPFPLSPSTAGEWKGWALSDRMQAHCVVIDRTHLCLLGPIRGDIAVFTDGHAAIVTEAQCSGCRHFRATGYTPRDAEVPSVIESRHWLSTVAALIRLVYASKPTPAPEPKGRRTRR